VRLSRKSLEQAATFFRSTICRSAFQAKRAVISVERGDLARVVEWIVYDG
jgi:hypothetical protein